MFFKKKKDRREKRIPRTYGGYPSGDRTAEEMPPPPSSWTAGPGSRPVPEQDARETPANRS